MSDIFPQFLMCSRNIGHREDSSNPMKLSRALRLFQSNNAWLPGQAYAFSSLGAEIVEASLEIMESQDQNSLYLIPNRGQILWTVSSISTENE